MVSHISTAIEGINNALSPIFNAANSKYSRWLKEHKHRIITTYGDHLSDDEILDIVEAEEMQADCRNCNRAPNEACPHATFLQYSIGSGGKISKETCPKRLYDELERRSELSRIPKIYRHLTFEDYDSNDINCTAISQAKRVAQQNQNLIIRGDVGTGKTMLASIIATELIKQHNGVLFTTLNDIIIELDAKLPSERPAYIEWLSEITCLIIDDLGTEPATAQVESLLFQLINNRYNNNNRVIVTTNLEVDLNIASLSRKRIFSRLKSSCVEIILKGPDRRLQGNLREQD